MHSRILPGRVEKCGLEESPKYRKLEFVSPGFAVSPPWVSLLFLFLNFSEPQLPFPPNEDDNTCLIGLR